MKQIVLGAAFAASLPALAKAHFLTEYTDQTFIERPGDIPVKIAFWHPMENGHVMDLEKPLEFFMVHRGEKTDLMDRLTATTFSSAEATGAAFDATVPIKRSGDYAVVTVPQPYFEESEDIYIQQITKTFLNRNQLPTDWDTPLGLPTEILPLNKPYNVIAGGTFTGQVLRDGAPAAGIEIEIEYMAAEPDMAGTGVQPATSGPMPGGMLVAITDANGVFTFGVPRAGHWGFAALGSGPDTEHNGKELSQDAVLWIRAWDME